MSAIQQLLTDYLDIWTAADIEKKSGRGRSSGNSASVYGIKKLRKLILELAVCGQLIAQEKEWKNTTLGGLGRWAVGSGFPTAEQGQKTGEILFAKVSDMNNSGNEKFIADTNNTITDETARRLKINVHPIGTVIFPKIGGAIATNKRRVLVKPTAIDNNCLGLIPNFEVSTEWLYLVLSSIDFSKYQAGTSVPALSQSVLQEIPALLPPEPEQHRIAAKVDELMALCDQLETQHNNAAEAHEKLVSQLLATLTQSQNAEEFNENWQRIAAHFDTLFTTESSIDTLKQTLLQLAVMGKLVSQDPNDEPASELLKKTQAEKAKLIAEGKIKKEKSLDAISEEEASFELPRGWSWSRLIDLSILITKGSSPKWQGINYTDNPTDVMFVTSENVGSYDLLLESPKFVEKKFNEIEPRSILQKGDYLMNIVGASIGRTAIFNIDALANINQAVCLIRPLASHLSQSFLLHFFNSEICRGYMFDKQVDNARPNLSMGNIAKFVIPIPPLAEQHRIVAKVDELMALCDQLKSRITAANQLQQKLVDAMVEQALTSEYQSVEIEVPARSEARALLGAEIIHQLHKENKFGRVKFQKIFHLCESIAEIDTIESEYDRHAAGPYDPQMIETIETDLKRKRWYQESQHESGRHIYTPLEMAGEHRKQFGEYWQTKLPIIQKLIDVMCKWETKRCEIFSTLYAAWNDLLIFGKPVSDEAILSEVLERWNDSKTKISKKDWLENLEWMRKKGFIPKGTGRATRAEGLFD